MKFSYIFLFQFAICFLNDVKAETIPARLGQQEESLDMDLENPVMTSKESPENIDNIIRQRRKTINELLNNFKEDMIEEQESLNAKRSIHLKNPKYSNYWRRLDDNNINSPESIDGNIQELNDERNAVVPFKVPSGNKSEVTTETYSELKDERGYGGAVKDDKSTKQENEESLKKPNKNNRKQSGQVKQDDNSSGGKEYSARPSIRNDNFNADLQDYDEEQNPFTIGDKTRNDYGYNVDFGNPRKFQNNPYTCCLCGECKSINAQARHYLYQHYMKPNMEKQIESEGVTGATDTNGFDSFKYPMDEPDAIKTIQFKTNKKLPYQDFQLQMDNTPLIDPYAWCRNNLSHEANYKLSKLEQDAAEKRGNFSWLWPNWGLHKRRSLQFNPMNEIKLKTSSRLMDRGFGPSLPSYSLGENRREYMIDNILKKKELNFQKDNGKYHDLEAIQGVVDPVELRNPESWEDLKNSDTEIKPKVMTSDWNHIRKKRISEKQRFKEENKSLRDPQSFKEYNEKKHFKEHQRFKRVAEEKRFQSSNLKDVKRKPLEHHSLNGFETSKQEIPFLIDKSWQVTKNVSYRSRRSKRSISNLNPLSDNSKPNLPWPRDAANLNDPYEDYNSLQNYKDLNFGQYQELLNNNLESLKKEQGTYKTKSDAEEDFNKNLYKREKSEELQHLDQIMSANKWQDKNLYNKREQSNTAAYMNEQKYLRFKEPSDNYVNLKSELNSKWKETALRQKKFARPAHRQPKKNKGNSKTKGRNGLKVEKAKQVPSKLINHKEVSAGTFNMDNLNKFDRYHDYSNKNWPRHLYKQYPDMRYRTKAANNTSGFRPTQASTSFIITTAVPSNDDSKISLELRNEILNCTAYSSLENFLKSLPKNITQELMETTTAEGSEEIEFDLTTLDIDEPTTENPAWTTQEPYTEIDDITEPTSDMSKPPESWETSTLDSSDCLDITETLNSTRETTTEQDSETSATPIPNEDTSSWGDDFLSGSTSTTEPWPLSSSASAIDDVKLNITINANVQGNSKNKHFNGNGTINVKPGFEDDRLGRHVQKRKCSASPKTKPSANNYDDELFNNLSSGKLSANIVKTVFGEVQNNPELKALWPSLKHNQLSEKPSLPYLYSIRDKGNDEQIQHSQNLMAKTMDAINDIIDQQVRSRSCVVLRPDLQEFYDLIVKSNQQQENRREKRKNNKEQITTKVHETAPAVDVVKAVTIKKLLKQYEALPQQEQQRVRPIRDILISEQAEMEKLRDPAERQISDDRKGKRHVGLQRENGDISDVLKKYYTPEYLKLQKAADLYRAITNESDDGMP